jgi:hypothetical protein
LESPADASATEPSTMKLERNASCQGQLDDREISRTHEYNPNPMNIATVEYSMLLPNIK